MNKKYLFLPIVIVILILFVGFIAYFNKPIASNGSITSFSYHFGSYFPGYMEYDITYKNSTYHLSIQGYNDYHVNVEKNLSIQDVEELASIINQYHIYEWNGFDQSDTGVMDGNGFHLDVVYEDGSHIGASGYMKYPAHYQEGHEKLVSFFKKYY